jgi:hypothetical protein
MISSCENQLQKGAGRRKPLFDSLRRLGKYMMSKQITRFILLLLWVTVITIFANAQTDNLLLNPKANDGANNWRAFGNAEIEQSDDGDWRFVVRNKGSFSQDVQLPEDAAGKYALLIGRVSSERIDPDGAITGLPYLYGYMMDSANPRDGRILSYLQGQQMLCPARTVNEWVTAWGIFEVPDGTHAIRFFLNQAERKDVPQNGSAARFDDIGLYLFSTEWEAKAFAQAYKD